MTAYIPPECGKVRHTKPKALAHARKLHDSGMVAYRCGTCGGWHVGHRIGLWTRLWRRARREKRRERNRGNWRQEWAWALEGMAA